MKRPEVQLPPEQSKTICLQGRPVFSATEGRRKGRLPSPGPRRQLRGMACIVPETGSETADLRAWETLERQDLYREDVSPPINSRGSLNSQHSLGLAFPSAVNPTRRCPVNAGHSQPSESPRVAPSPEPRAKDTSCAAGLQPLST